MLMHATVPTQLVYARCRMVVSDCAHVQYLRVYLSVTLATISSCCVRIGQHSSVGILTSLNSSVAAKLFDMLSSVRRHPPLRVQHAQTQCRSQDKENKFSGLLLDIMCYGKIDVVEPDHIEMRQTRAPLPPPVSLHIIAM